jgi:hypothetical protein
MDGETFAVGDRVRILSSGGNWHPGTVIDGQRIARDKGDIWPINSGEFVRKLEPKKPVPVPLPGVKVGDRVRVVVASPPMEHLLDSVGTVRAIGSAGLSGLISVQVDIDFLPRWFRRASLDLLDENNWVPEQLFFDVVVGCRARSYKKC